MDINQIRIILGHLLSPDTSAIRSAEAQLKPHLKSPPIVSALVQCLQDAASTPAPVRHVAGVILRKCIGKHYLSFQASDKSSLKAVLLQVLQTEPERQVRISVVSVVAVVASLEFEPDPPGPGWPELLQFIAAAAQDSIPDARELAFFLLAEMSETIGFSLKPQLPQLALLYGTSLQDSQPKVQTAALKALGKIMAYLADDDEQILHFAGLIPQLLNVASGCQQRCDEDTLQAVDDVLYDLCHCTAAAVSAHLPTVIRFALSVMTDSRLELVTRDSAALVVSTLTEFKPKLVAKKTDVGAMIEAFMSMIETSEESAAGAFFDSNPNWKEDGDDDDDEDYDGPTQCGMAQGCLDMLAINLPQKHFFHPAVTMCIQRMSASHPAQRKAGIASLGVIAEGCQEKLSEHLEQVLPHVFALAGDADAQVRECTCFCLGQLSEHCQPEIIDWSDQILPCVFKLLDDQSVNVQTTSCYVLEMFCESLEPESVLPFLRPLMEKLVSMLQGATRKCVQEMAVAAIAATAVAAEKEFTPYLDGVARLMMTLMNLSEEAQYPLKGRAMECMGHLAVAVEKEAFRPYFIETVKVSAHSLSLDSTDLHEYAFAVFANLSKVMEREFSGVLPELVPHTLEVIKKEDGGIENFGHNSEAEEDGGFNLGDSDDDEDGPQPFVVRTGMLDTKKAALTALGNMASYCSTDFMPYLEECFGVLKETVEYWHPEIIIEAIRALPGLAICSVAATGSNGKVEWTKGDLSTNAMSAHTFEIVNAVMPLLVAKLQNVDRDVVSAACEAIQAIIELCGPFSMTATANDMLNSIVKLMKGEAPSQAEEEYEEDDEEEDDEHQNFLNAAFDLLGAIGRVMGAQLANYLDTFLPLILSYNKPSKPANDRGMSLGCLGELAQGVGPAIAPHWQSALLPSIVQGLADENNNVRRNAAFTAGVCAESLPDIVAPAFPQILQGLHPLFSVDTSGDAGAAVVDNAAAAVARMITARPASLPMAQVLPVFLNALPLKSDMTENETVYTCLAGIAGSQELNPMAQEVRRVVTEACKEGSKVDDEIKARLRAAFGN